MVVWSACTLDSALSSVPAETSTFCVHGLWQRPLRAFVDFLAGERFNALRIPVSAELALSLDAIQPNGISFDANPHLQVKHLGTYSGPFMVDKSLGDFNTFVLALSLDAIQPNGISFEANPQLQVKHLGTYSGAFHSW